MFIPTHLHRLHSNPNPNASERRLQDFRIIKYSIFVILNTCNPNLETLAGNDNLIGNNLARNGRIGGKRGRMRVPIGNRATPSSLTTPSSSHMIKLSEQNHAPAPATENTAVDVLLDENLLYEVLKHVDEWTLGAASCVCKQWHRTAQDERLWELICTKHWANMSCGDNQLRSVVLALGGFRRLHAHYLWPLSKSSGLTTVSSSSSSTVAAAVSSAAWPCLPTPRTIGLSMPTRKTRWGKDEVQLSLSLLSIRYFEKINFRNQNKSL
ncbi:hypothetical protein L1987_08898 [Smallanthus sonchifolius]|uniref:Uncharacterized protein n=1 Tax=Smallanthus sonchifolius TaxID=185202 RepID=A0ACB9JLW0_9ASTR|nr:hypothetical protein L1987_08898 [Smallanthus sonchifolius]